jgi:hypothetical protein
MTEINNGAIIREKELLDDIKVLPFIHRSGGLRSPTSTTRRRSSAVFKT